MARIVVIGGGLIGLAAALLLARDGHGVTVLERDVAEPDGNADALWCNWERPDVSQFRLPHQMLAYWRRLMELELPEVVDEVERLGGQRLSWLDALPAALTGGSRAGDEDLRVVSARRPVVEGALAAVAARAPGVTVRRGAKAVALVTGRSKVNGVPHVGGVVIDGDETLTADLVVDAMGRHTSIDRMLEAMGAPRPQEQSEDLGYVYYARQFRNNEPGSVPVANALVPYEGMSLLTSSSDADTYSLVFFTASKDRDLRRLRDVDAWERALALFPDVRPLWSVSTPTTDIHVIAGATERRRFFVIDGMPVVTGLVALGDAAVQTNPSLGRGSSMGLVQACTLRDVLREVGPDRPDELALRFAEADEAVVGPLYRMTLAQDRNRMAEIQADIAGTPHQRSDATWNLQRVLERLMLEDADALRVVMRHALYIEPSTRPDSRPHYARRSRLWPSTRRPTRRTGRRAPSCWRRSRAGLRRTSRSCALGNIVSELLTDLPAARLVIYPELHFQGADPRRHRQRRFTASVWQIALKHQRPTFSCNTSS